MGKKALDPQEGGLAAFSASAGQGKNTAAQRPILDPDVAFPSRYNSCSGLLPSVSPRKAGVRCAQHTVGRCNCGTAPWHLCNTAPQGFRKDKTQVWLRTCVCVLGYPSPLPSASLEGSRDWENVTLLLFASISASWDTNPFTRPLWGKVPYK